MKQRVRSIQSAIPLIAPEVAPGVAELLPNVPRDCLPKAGFQVDQIMLARAQSKFFELESVEIDGKSVAFQSSDLEDGPRTWELDQDAPKIRRGSECVVRVRNKSDKTQPFNASLFGVIG
jgi:hypothetical protein